MIIRSHGYQFTWGLSTPNGGYDPLAPCLHLDVSLAASLWTLLFTVTCGHEGAGAAELLARHQVTGRQAGMHLGGGGTEDGSRFVVSGRIYYRWLKQMTMGKCV